MKKKKRNKKKIEIPGEIRINTEIHGTHASYQ